MKRKIEFKWALIAILAISFSAIIFTSCEDDETITIDSQITEVENLTYANEVFDEIEDLGDEATEIYEFTTAKDSKSTEEGGGKFLRLGECVTITKEFTDDLIVTTIDFGEEFCLCNDGRERKGKIVITQTGHYWDGLVELTFTFDGYFVDGNQVTGEKSVIRSINEEGNRVSEIIVDGQIILSDGAGTITWHAERTREVVEGSDTRMKHDDVIEVTGSSSGTNADGVTYSTEILTPLVKIHSHECHHFFVEGTMSIIQGEESEKIIDFGDGTCDNLATVTQDGITETIELCRHRYRLH